MCTDNRKLLSFYKRGCANPQVQVQVGAGFYERIPLGGLPELIQVFESPVSIQRSWLSSSAHVAFAFASLLSTFSFSSLVSGLLAPLSFSPVSCSFPSAFEAFLHGSRSLLPVYRLWLLA